MEGSFAMAQFLRAILDDGSVVEIETSDPRAIQAMGGDDEAIAVPLGKMEKLAKVAASLCASLRETVGPDEVALELGAGWSGGADWFIAKTTVEATVKITLTWKNTGPSGPAPQ
jgi:hypothetical protein